MNTKETFQQSFGDNNKAKAEASFSFRDINPRLSLGYDFGNNIRAAIDYTRYAGLSSTISSKGNIKLDGFNSSQLPTGTDTKFKILGNSSNVPGTELDLAAIFKQNNNAAAVSADVEADVSVNTNTEYDSVGIAGFYDFAIHEQFKPYIGARVGMNFVKNKASGKVKVKSTSNNVTTEQETKIGEVTVSDSQIGVAAIVGVGYQIAENAVLDAGYRFSHYFKKDGKLPVLNAHEFSVGARIKF